MATAYQTVSAVLEATNKAYIVELGDSEDGKNHYRRWSDGTIEQWGYIQTNSTVPYILVFPIAFSDTNYCLNLTLLDPETYDENNVALCARECSNGRTTTNVKLKTTWVGSTTAGLLTRWGLNWKATGK